MKSSVLFLLISFFVCLSSCKKNNDSIVEVSNFTAMKNNASWVSTSNWASYSKKDKKFNITGAKRDPKYYQEECLGLNFTVADLSAPLVTHNFSASWSYVIGGDVLSDSYNMDTSAANQIHITSIDTQKKLISGTFIVRLVRDARYSDQGEFFQFTEGQFTIGYSEIE